MVAVLVDGGLAGTAVNTVPAKALGAIRGRTAASAQTEDYWQEGAIATVRCSPPTSSPRWTSAACQETVAGVSRRVTLAWLSWKLWSETRVSRAVDWNSGRVAEPQETIVVLSLATVRASPSLRSPA